MVWNISGYDVLIDDEDYERLKDFKYYIKRATLERQNLYYFERHVWVGSKYTTSSLHRDIMGCVNKDGKFVDHIDGNTLDNRKKNLRLCSKTDNNRNSKLRKDNTSGVKGVSWHKQHKKWCAEISVNNIIRQLGLYDDIKDAEAAYAKASKEFHGEFSRLK